MERFWSKVEKTGTCWNWTAYTLRGRGMFQFQGGMKYAPRVSWYLHYGEWPKEYVLHKCDNPSCVNPDHLFLGSQDDNMKDMVKKRRQAYHRGEENGRCKTTLETVIEIKKLLKTGLKTSEIRDMGHPYGLVRAIKSGKNWAHVEI